MVDHVLSWSTIKYHQLPWSKIKPVIVDYFNHGQPRSGNVTPWSTMVCDHGLPWYLTMVRHASEVFFLVLQNIAGFLQYRAEIYLILQYSSIMLLYMGWCFKLSAPFVDKIKSNAVHPINNSHLSKSLQPLTILQGSHFPEKQTAINTDIIHISLKHTATDSGCDNVKSQQISSKNLFLFNLNRYLEKSVGGRNPPPVPNRVKSLSQLVCMYMEKYLSGTSLTRSAPKLVILLELNLIVPPNGI
ncbi:hypothetical protein GQR58_013937 [Nymphon striatum]|nr:hypothetical protein GQR58_013937 [Nymphon striatum]